MLIHLRIMNGLKVARILYVHYPIVKKFLFIELKLKMMEF